MKGQSVKYEKRRPYKQPRVTLVSAEYLSPEGKTKVFFVETTSFYPGIASAPS